MEVSTGRRCRHREQQEQRPCRNKGRARAWGSTCRGGGTLRYKNAWLSLPWDLTDWEGSVAAQRVRWLSRLELRCAFGH